jgi:shikimate dehydrogenase
MSLFRLGVIGNPISHSQSPIIHHTFAEASGVNLSYDKYLVAPEQLAQFIGEFFSHSDAKGLNVTLPFKQDVMGLCDHLTAAASEAGAVNTLIKDNAGNIIGDNTDGLGLIQDLRDCHMLNSSCKILIVGAGGAAKGIIAALKSQDYSDISLINRTHKNADELAKRFAIRVLNKPSMEGHVKKRFDLIINTASMGGEQLIESYHINPQAAFVYDISYGERAKHFLDAMQKLGAAKTVDGLGMLVNQAAHAFKAWFGVLPETTKAKALLVG